MQEICNNCFGSKKYSTTLPQAKTDKLECRNVTAMYSSSIVVYDIPILSEFEHPVINNDLSHFLEFKK